MRRPVAKHIPTFGKRKTDNENHPIFSQILAVYNIRPILAVDTTPFSLKTHTFFSSLIPPFLEKKAKAFNENTPISWYLSVCADRAGY